MPDPERTAHGSPDQLESLYRLAQTLTANAEEAAWLVEATYRHAAQQASSTSPEKKPWSRLELVRLMTELARSSGPDAPAPASSAVAADEPTFRGFRRRAALRLTSQKLPAAFAALPAEARLLLLLCKVEQYSCADAAHVLDLTPEKACAQLDRAMQALREKLHESVAPAERTLLTQTLTDDALRRALRQMAASEFAAPPPSLREGAATPRQAASTAPARIAGAAEAAPRQKRRAGPSGTTHPPRSSRLQRALLALLLIGFVGMAGYLADRWLSSSSETDIVALSVQETGRTQAALQTNSTTAAEQFVREQLGQRLTIPSIEGAALRSVSIVEIAPDARVPVLRYEDTAFGGDEEVLITTYVYTYALLGRHEDRLQMDRDVLRQIGERDQAETRTVGEQAVLIWRDRDEIFVATAPGNPDDLRARLSF